MSNRSPKQGCALTAPEATNINFGFGQVRKSTRSPGWALWLIVFLADKAAKNFNMLVVTVYETSQKMFFLRTKQSVQRPFHMISKKIALNLEHEVWHFLVIVLKKSCYFCSDSGKARLAKQCDLLLCEPGNHSLCKFNIFYDCSRLRLLGQNTFRLWLLFPCI